MNYLADKGMMMFVVKAKNNSYFGLGFGPTMTNTDMVIWQANGDKSTQWDAWSANTLAPTQDSSNGYDTTFVYDKASATVTFTSYRKLDTKLAKNYVIALDKQV